MNAEHGEENVQVKAYAYVHRWVDRIWVKEIGVVKSIFSNTNTLKNSNIKSKKVTKTY